MRGGVAPRTHRQLLQFKGLKFQLVRRRHGAGDSWEGGAEGSGLHPGERERVVRRELIS